MKPADYEQADHSALVRELELRDKLILKLDAQLTHYDEWYGDDCPCGTTECPLALL